MVERRHEIARANIMHMKKEIEVKAKVDDLQELRQKLENLGCIFGDSVKQEDTIFCNFDGDYTKFMPGSNFLRIRKAKGKIMFTLKQPQANELDCIEKETEISDAEQMKGAIELLGYHEAVRVVKTRTKTKYQEMEICLDEVEGLGSFIEVEKITDGDGEMVQNELFDFLQTLGIARENRMVNGYDTLIFLKRNGNL